MSIKKSNAATVFGIIVTALSVVANAVHLPWLIWLSVEQIQTGWGFGTWMELAVLWPWMIEFILSPILIAGIAFLIFAIFRRPKKGVLISSAVLTGLLFLQFFLLNLFIIV